MIPQINDYVKIIFNTGLVEEGQVVEWSDSVCLQSPLSGQLLLIPNMNYILAVKLQPNQKTDSPPQDMQLRAKTLAELHQLKIQEERAMVRDKLTTLKNEGVVPTEYGLPRKLGQPVFFDSPTENRGCDRGYQKPSSAEIRGAFRRR